MSSMMKQVRLLEASMIHLGKIFSGVSIGRKMRASHKVEPHGINLHEHKIIKNKNYCTSNASFNPILRLRKY